MVEEPQWKSEQLVSDAVGRLIEFWGFKRNMGRLWAVLYLSEQPLSAPVLQARLQLSAGAVSMTLSELSRWGVVRKVFVEGERRDHYAAEGDLWKMISRVFRERELVEVLDSIDAMEEALEHARSMRGTDAARAAFEEKRIRDLLELARLGRTLLERLVNEGKVDASGLLGVLLGKRE